MDTNSIKDAADRIAKAAEELGYQVERRQSSVSNSEYLIVTVQAGRQLKVRVSDHAARLMNESAFGAADYEVDAEKDTAWGCIEWLAGFRGITRRKFDERRVKNKH